MNDARTGPSWVWFATTATAGLVLAFFVFAMLAMGECLPRDDGPAMHACDVTKQRELWLYSAFVIVLIAVAAWLQARGSRIGRVLALASGLIAAVALWPIERLAS